MTDYKVGVVGQKRMWHLKWSVTVGFMKKSDGQAARKKRVIVAAIPMWDTKTCVQNMEAVEKKCICGGYWKIVSVNQVDVFVGPTRECEAWQKVIRRLVLRKICTKGKNHKRH
ncbi:hypothetical protein T07_14601 [Trichinella nelsoni]|uniref:Uncharacterized protein n=1 Tax=Trichinella nelsoni TaxID=6336 RepID=A0A0V0SHJ2_9BILA|nr:hypothetical protein T07_14601 [Trichinella nelsoni]